MPEITLPDGSRHTFGEAPTALDVARAIGPKLARDSVAARIQGRLCPMGTRIETNASVELVMRQRPEALDIIRDTGCFLLRAALAACLPHARVVDARLTTTGFQCDIEAAPALGETDLTELAARMALLVAADLPLTPTRWASATGAPSLLSPPRARQFEPGEECVLLPAAGYRLGHFLATSLGPLLARSGAMGAFRLVGVSGVHRAGDEARPMLSRIEALCWRDAGELDACEAEREAAAQRDHRRLGRALDLFHFREEAPGAVFWRDRGWTLFRLLIDYLRRRQALAGYQEINTPDVMDRSLWEVSGHWANYREHMFTTETADGRVLALKPMSCPGAVMMFQEGIRSYRDLPVRFAEFGKVHRYEPSGSLHGLLRVRHFTQDDAHVFCTPEQLLNECRDVITLVQSVYRDFGFDEIAIKLSTRPEHRMGSDADWDRLEATLAGALESLGLDYTVNAGEGAFYGPKLEFVLRDALGRDWQCGTLQVDLNLPERFGLHYVDAQGDKPQPVMLHRAIFGSLERFIGILLEHGGGRLPSWLAPLQVMVLSVSPAQQDYARSLKNQLCGRGIRAGFDISDDKIGYKVRHHTLMKVPYLVIVGRREAEAGQLSLRHLDGREWSSLDIDDLCARLLGEAPVDIQTPQVL